MGLSTTYTKAETDYLLQQIDKKVAVGLKGIATQANAPTPYSPSTHPNGLFERYIVNTPITSPNSWGNIAVTQAELNANTVFFNVTNGVVSKELSIKPVADPAKLPLYSAIKSANIVAGTQFIDDENGNVVYRVKTGQTLLISETPITQFGKLDAISLPKQTVLAHVKGELITNTLTTVGFWDFGDEILSTSAGYKHTGWLDWDGTETKIRYTGGLTGNVGICCADLGYTPLLKMGGVSVSPEYASDLVREFYIPKGTRKIIFSCTDARTSAFKVEVLEDSIFWKKTQDTTDIITADIYSTKNIGDTVADTLPNVGFYDAINNVINTSAGYKHTGWLDWDGTEAIVRYKGAFAANSGMGAKDENGKLLYSEGGKSSFPQFTNDNFRTIKIPKGTRKIIFSCTDALASRFSVKIIKKPLVSEITPKTLQYATATELSGLNLGDRFYAAFNVKFGNLNLNTSGSVFANICGVNLETINGKPTTFVTETVGFTTNCPIPKLISGIKADTQQYVPDWKKKLFVGTVQFSIRYTGTPEGQEDIYISFDGTTITIGKDAGSVTLYSYTTNAGTKISEVIDHMKANLANFEITDYLKDCLTSELLTFGKVYLVSKFATQPNRSAFRLDAFRFNFRKAVCDDSFNIEIIKTGSRLYITINGDVFFTKNNVTATNFNLYENNCKITDIEINNNSLNNVDILASNRLITPRTPVLLTLMLHSVYKCRETDGVNPHTVYPALKPHADALVPMSVERLTKILFTAKKKGYTIVTAEQVDNWVNGKGTLPNRSLCLLHDDREDYIYTDSDISAIYESYSAKGSVANIVDAHDYGNTPQKMRQDGWSAINHFKIHQPLIVFPSSTLYTLCRESISDSKSKNVYGTSLVYPGGGHSPVVLEALEVTGYTSAWITTEAYTKQADSKFRLKRTDAADQTLWSNVEPLFV